MVEILPSFLQYDERQSNPDTVIDLISRLSLARGLDEVMAIVRRGARHLTGADGVSFVLRDDGKCFYADEDAIGPLWKGQRFPMQACISGWAMLNRQPVVIEDIYLDPRIPHDAYRRTFVKSLVMVPVRQEDPVAAIGAYWAHQRCPTKDEVDLLMTIANGAAVAMTNVALYASLVAAKEEAERNAMVAEQAGRAKLFFLANISHELRTPLNAIIGFAQIMQATQPAPGAAQYSENLDCILQAGNNLLRLVEDLLDMSRLEDGQFSLDPCPVTIATVVDEAVEALGLQAAEAGVELSLAAAPSAATVRADRRAIKQVLLNLLANAVKFTPRGGRIDVEWPDCDDGCTVAIRDTGIGMSPQELERVREPFVQTARERHQFHQGAGLGLSIANALVHLQGGRLDIASCPEKGTTVSVHLPLWTDEAARDS
ncbi:Putative histidine kinase [Magnetospirillum sp. XM-1]|uniref:sensor histidine kinase n=1 Tax=Magnetospirillum sp. XM-1 TaxID=1663591 RepID=UPI00073DF9E7|nr:HAMP domain-containing sensor histidine kinase [Magnetospirillum sp. XM-1]CUW37776.1 Putative histidine kinase [Magnetospirillum sp. XM-1]